MVKCSVEKCPKGVISCCQFCTGKDFCEFVCECKTPCEYQEAVSAEPRQKKDKPLNLIISILILLMSIMLLGASGNMRMMQTDTLNTLMDIETQIDVLSNKNSVVEQVDQSGDKTVTRGIEERSQLSQSEREYIERVCMAECRSGGVVGMAAAAQCISDRANLWDMTPLEVVCQQDQFAEPYMGEISAEAVQAVWAVFDEGMRIFEDNNVTHFYKEGTVEPYWAKEKTYVQTVGGNKFYESNY